MYQALYRKYRSQTFDEMVGQEVVAKTLKQAVASKKISHAYLFSGPRGTGKTSAAKIFAKAMNCPHQADGEPCNNCDICHDITNGSLKFVISQPMLLAVPLTRFISLTKYTCSQQGLSMPF